MTPPAIQVAPTQAATLAFSSEDVAGSIAMDELDLIGDAEFYSTEFRLLGEQLAHVDAGADDTVIACPGAQHLPRTATEVEHWAPDSRRSAAPRVASFSGVIGLWMR